MEQSELHNQLLSLSKEERENPLSVLENFFADHSLGDLRSFLTDVLETCLTTDNYPFGQAERRADFILYRKKIEHVFEAASIIVKQPLATGKSRAA